jgi:hypothetical protein
MTADCLTLLGLPEGPVLHQWFKSRLQIPDSTRSTLIVMARSPKSA